MRITDEFLSGLEAKAKAATQGDWVAVLENPEDDGSYAIVETIDDQPADCLTNEDAEYIAAAQPARILAMIAELRQARLGLLQCADWFGGYAEGHEAKGDVDKATRNRKREAMARRGLL